MVMNLAQAMLTGRGFEAFLNGRRARDKKNKTHRAREQTEYTPQYIYDCAIFQLEIRAFDIQSGWRDDFEGQREYMRRYLFMRKTHKNQSKTARSKQVFGLHSH
jgi:hypothetical protein